MEEISFDSLPDEMLNMIFNCLNFHGHLRLSGVCQRFQQVISNDVTFMRTVNFLADQAKMRKLMSSKPSQARLMRAYRNVVLEDYETFEKSYSALEIELLENAEVLKLVNCKFRDASEFVKFLQHCQQLETVYIDREGQQRMFKDNNEPSEKYQKPVSLNITRLDCELLTACFANIVHISILHWTGVDKARLLDMLYNHAAAVTSMHISDPDSDDFFNLLDMKPELKLKRLKLSLYNDLHVERIAQFFARQSSFLTELSTWILMGHTLFDAIRLNLANLITLKLVVHKMHNFRLNDLKVLPKLKKLDVTFSCFEDYALDFAGFASLEHLILYSCDNIKLVLERLIVTMKKLRLDLQVDGQLLRQVVKMFPNLQSLELKSYRRAFDENGRVINQADEINKLVQLQTLACSGEYGEFHLINDQFLSSLRLPNLRQLMFYGVRKPFESGVLKVLARNCRNLLTIAENTQMFVMRDVGKDSVFILYKRKNGTKGFRRLRRPIGMDKFTMDDDSM